MDQDQPVIVVGGAVVRLALADAAEGPVNVVIGHVILLSQVFVIQAQLTQPHPADGLGRFIVGNMLRVTDVLFVNAFEP